MPERTIILHLGMPKTGTTSIQSALFRDREGLLQKGVLYPGFAENHTTPLASVFVENPHRLQANMLAGIQTSRQGQAVAAKWSARLDEALRMEGWNRLVISAEGLIHLRPEQMEMLRNRLLRHCDRVIVVLCLRNPYHWRVSDVQQRLKNGATIDRAIETLARPNLYRRLTRRIEQCFGADNLRLLIFEELKAQPAGLVNGFCDAIGIPRVAAPSPGEDRRNASMSHRACMVLDRLNARVPLFLEGRRNPQRSLTVDRLLRRLPGSRFTLSSEQAGRLREAVETDRRWIRRRLGRDVWPDELPGIQPLAPEAGRISGWVTTARILGRIIP